MSSPSQDKPTTDTLQPSESESWPAGSKRSASGLGQRLAGVANIVHGAGEVIRGNALAVTDRDHSPGKAIAVAGKDEIQRGLNRFECKSSASATADAAGAADTRASEYPRDEKAAPPGPPSHWLAATDGPAAQRDTDISQQATGPPSNDRDRQIGATPDDPDPNAAPLPEHRPPPPAAEQEVGA